MQFEDQSWTWDEHVQLSADRAAWLRAVRVDGPFHVGVLLDNIPEFSMLLGAAALTGAVIVGLNPTRRGRELVADIERTDCQLVVTEQKYLPELQGQKLPVGDERLHVVDGPTWDSALAPFAGSPRIAPPSRD